MYLFVTFTDTIRKLMKIGCADGVLTPDSEDKRRRQSEMEEKMKKLEEKDREKILEYVGQEPEMNLFFIGDIENHGIDTEEVSIFALEDAEGWDCVLLKYFDFYIIY